LSFALWRKIWPISWSYEWKWSYVCHIYWSSRSVVLKYFGSVDPLKILYTLENPLPLHNVYILVCISTSNTDLKQIFYLKFYTVLTLQNIYFPVALHFLTLKFNEKNDVFSVMTPAVTCPVELLKYSVSCHLRLRAGSSSLTWDPLRHFTCFFHWKKTKQLNNRADPQGSADHHLRNSTLDHRWKLPNQYGFCGWRLWWFDWKFKHGTTSGWCWGRRRLNH
jgi:hypothetical protein